MIFNESNVKVIRENGYLSKYEGKKAPYFPFTKDDIENKVIVLNDKTYYDNGFFYLISYINNIAYFICFSSLGANRLNFDFNTMRISSNKYNWAVGGN